MNTCSYCGKTYEGRSWTHKCRTADLPRARRRSGKYAMRRHPGDGHVLWVDVPSPGTSYIVGHVMDPENFEHAVDVAEEEMHTLVEQAKEEFGF